MQVIAYTKQEPGAHLKPHFIAYSVAWRSNWEMSMIKASARIRFQEDWIAKLKDKYSTEMRIRRFSDPILSKEHHVYLAAELHYYAKLQGANIRRGTMLSGVDMVWTMHVPQRDALAKDFRANVISSCAHFSTNTQLRPFTEYDDQPWRGNMELYAYQVRSRINPSLCTLLFGKSSLLDYPITSPLDALNLPSFGRVPGSHDAWKQAVRELNQRMAGDDSFTPINEEYIDKLNPDDRHWLPTDIYVNDDGSVDIKSYINNLHPGKYPEAYKSISKVIAKCIPALEQVLTDLKHPRDLRLPYDLEACVSEAMSHPNDYRYSNSPDPAFDYEAEERKWNSSLHFSTPMPDAFSEPGRPLVPYSLRNKSLQVIVKMDDMYANPTRDFDNENEWEGDGTASEQIIATAVYFYDVKNDSGASVWFREGISALEINSPIESKRVNHMFTWSFGTRSILHFEQAVGNVKIKQGQILCYPNVYQHCISGFYPKDSSKICHIKALTIYFVDPTIRIVSTSVVPPQQKEWWTDQVLQTPLLKSLSRNIGDQIIENVDMPIAFNQASKIGRKLDKMTFEANNENKSIDDCELGDDRFCIRVFNPDFEI